MALKNHICTIALFITVIFVSCKTSRKNNGEINKIEIARGDCLRGCTVVGLIIDSTLNMQYYGGFKATLRGYYHGKVTPGFWDTLNIKLKQINFKKLDTYNHLPVDGEQAEAIFYWGTNKRHVFVSIEKNADSAASVFTWIINSYKCVELQKLNNSVKFETTFQYMQPPSPPSPADRLLFPPLKKRIKKQ